MHNKIINIDHDTIVLKIGVSESTVCGCNAYFDTVKLIIRPDAPRPIKKPVYHFHGCDMHTEYVSCDHPRVEYPLYEVDEDNNLVFYFDGILHTLKAGRYKGEILLNGSIITTIDIALFLGEHKINNIMTETI